MEKENIILIIKKYMKEMLSMINLKETENIFMKVENFMKGNLKMIKNVVKVYYMIKKDILFMKGILSMINLKEMEYYIF